MVETREDRVRAARDFLREREKRAKKLQEQGVSKSASVREASRSIRVRDQAIAAEQKRLKEEAEAEAEAEAARLAEQRESRTQTGSFTTNMVDDPSDIKSDVLVSPEPEVPKKDPFGSLRGVRDFFVGLAAKGKKEETATLTTTGPPIERGIIVTDFETFKGGERVGGGAVTTEVMGGQVTRFRDEIVTGGKVTTTEERFDVVTPEPRVTTETITGTDPNLIKIPGTEAVKSGAKVVGGFASDVLGTTPFAVGGLFGTQQTLESGEKLEGRFERVKQRGQEGFLRFTPVAGAAILAQSYLELRGFREERKAVPFVESSAIDQLTFIGQQTPVLGRISGGVEDINVKIDDLNTRIADFNIRSSGGGDFAQERSDLGLESIRLGSASSLLQGQQSGVLSRFRGRGIEVKTTDQTFVGGALEFTSPGIRQFETIGPAAGKQLATLSTPEKVGRIGGTLLGEAATFAVIGGLSGGTGASAKTGQFLGSIGVKGKVAKTAGAGVILTGASLSGAKGLTAGIKTGTPRSLGILEFGRPFARTGGFLAGSALGSKEFARITARNVARGEFTRSTEGVKTGERVNKQQFRTFQQETVRARVQGTNIRIKQTIISKGKESLVGKGKFKAVRATTITGAGKKVSFFEKGKVFQEAGTRAFKFKTPSTGKIFDISLGRSRSSVELIGSAKNKVGLQIKAFNVNRISESLGGGTLKAGTKPIISKAGLFRRFDRDIFTSFGKGQQVTEISPNKQFFFTVEGGGDIGTGILKNLSTKAPLAFRTTTKLPSLLSSKGGQLQIFRPTTIVKPPLAQDSPLQLTTMTPTVAPFPSEVSSFLTPQIASQVSNFSTIGSTAFSPAFLTRPSTGSSFRFDTLTINRPREIARLSPVSFQTPGVESIQASAQTQGISTVSIPKQITETIAPSTGLGGFAFTPTPTPFGGFFLPRIGSGVGERKPKGRRTKRRFKRAPSFGAAVLGITASKAGPLEITGLTERPIIGKIKRRDFVI